MKLLPLLSLFFLFQSNTGLAQKSIESRLDSLNAISLSFVAKPDSLAVYADRAYAMAKQANYQKGLAIASKMMGISSFYSGDFNRAIEFHDKSLELQRKLKDSLEIAKAYYNLATTYNAKSDYANTTEIALKAIRMFELLGDHNGQGRVYNLLGITSSKNKDYENAITYFKQYHKNAKLVNDSLEIATSLNNLGSTYTDIGKNDSAMYFLLQAVDIYKINGHRNLTSTYHNIGLLSESQGNLENAINYFELALVLAQKENNKPREANNLYDLGRVLRKINKNRRAEINLQKAKVIAEEIGDKFILSKTLEQLAHVNSELGQHKRAYNYLLESANYKDSIFDMEMAKSNEELQVEYETEKKEQTINALNQQSVIQQLRLSQKNNYLLFAIGAIVFLILGTLLFVRQRKLKAESVLQGELSKRQELATIEILEAEERERSRIAADLHDGLGQLLSAALFNLNHVNKSISAEDIGAKTNMDNAVTLVKNSYEEMREISHKMMPNALLKAGLAYSIREFINKITNDHLKIQLDIVGLNERLNQQTEILLYRCIQESVNNVIKHAQASRLNIQLVKDIDGFSVSIEDNGIGFDQSRSELKNGIGLKNMQARVALLNGSLDIDSVLGKGTVIVIFIPI